MAGTRIRPRDSPGQHARLWASKCRLLQPPSSTASGGPDLRGFAAPNGIHRWIRIRVVRNHLIITQASGSGLGAARGSTPRFGTQNSLPCIAWRSWRRGWVDLKPLPTASSLARGAGGGGRSAGGRHPDQASGQPGAACAPLGEQVPPPAAAIFHSFGRAGFTGVCSTQRHPSMDPDKGRPESPHHHPGIRIRPRSSPGLNAEVRNSKLPPLHRMA